MDTAEAIKELEKATWDHRTYVRRNHDNIPITIIEFEKAGDLESSARWEDWLEKMGYTPFRPEQPTTGQYQGCAFLVGHVTLETPTLQMWLEKGAMSESEGPSSI